MYSFLRRHGALILLVAFMYHELWENTHLQVLSQQEEPRQSSFHNVSSIVVCNSNSDSNNNHSSASTKKQPSSRLTWPLLELPPQVQPRAYEPWTLPLPCYPPSGNWRSNNSRIQEGLLFTKPIKTGGSTGVGVHLRVARNVARRHYPNQFPICRARFDHNYARLAYSKRNHTHSFLWSIVRDPASRLVSSFYFNFVSRGKMAPTDDNFRQFTTSQTEKSHYALFLSTNPNKLFEEEDAIFEQDPALIMNQILQEYNFIGVTERMEESVVALSMLMNLPLADVLFLTSKGSGGFDDGGYGNRHKCIYIVPSKVSPGMKEHLQSEELTKRIYWDRVLHQAANQSLDHTIDHVLGRAQFTHKLQQFQHAQAVAQERCLPQTVFPCSFAGGARQKLENETDCLWTDSGCGYKCLDQVATELDLWGPDGPLKFNPQEGFNLFRESQQQ